MIPKKYQKYKPEFLAQGKRGVVYKFTKDKKDYVIKVKKPSSEAEGRIENEAKFQKILNKHKIGMPLIDSSKTYLVREFAKGAMVKDYQGKLEPIFKQILKQCFILDQLKINKLEMHKPLKHIIIHRNKAVMIDFERCYYTERPKNVTQFCEYINRIKKRIPKKQIQEYKASPSTKALSSLLSYLS